MSIEETYKGMWSSDPFLLKSLLDAGETIIVKIITKYERIRAVKADKDCFIDLNSGTRFGRQMASTKDFVEMVSRIGMSFLVPQRPSVLEPKPLEWHPWANGDDGIGAVDGQWNFDIGGSGVWFIMFQGRCVENDSNADVESAKAAIHEWRVSHLKSMLP